jgi:hypothetical protein
LRVFENGVLRRIFGPMIEEVTTGWRILHNGKLHDLYPSPSIIIMIILGGPGGWRVYNTCGRYEKIIRALGPTQTPIHWVPGTLFLGLKRPWREADHSPQSIAEVKNVWSYISTSPLLLRGVVLS